MASAPVACPACGAQSGEDARFCARCGTELTGASRPQEARKVVTALFADVVGSTTLGERLDPEDFKSVVDGAIERMVAVIEELDGGVEDLRGDGLLALFGAPTAHEDDPERAVLAGLRIVEGIADYARSVTAEWGLESFSVRVGAETGLAALGPIGGRLQFGAMGDVLNTAARLQAEAAPDTVLVGERTRRIVESLFEWEEPRALELKGKAGAVHASRVLGLAPERGRTRGLPGVETELVGRERELALGMDAIQEVLAGKGGVLLLTGEPGMGKSRLLAELRDRFRRSVSEGGEPVWLEGRCASYGQSIPYLPFRVLLRDWLGVPQELPDAEVRGALESRITESVDAALVGSLLGLKPHPEETARLSGLHPEDVQLRTAETVSTLLEALAADGPLVVAFDDLHWADASSARLVESLLTVGERAAVLLVLSARAEADRPAWRIREVALRDYGDQSREITLEPLVANDRSLLHGLVGAHTLPPELEETVLERAEGNPLYLEELVRALIDSGAVRPGDGGFSFDHAVTVEVPESVERLALARADQLSAPARDVLGAAAVLGRRFSVPLLEAVADRGAAVTEALRELRRSQLLREARRWPEPQYRFKHSLIQEAVYRSLLKRRRHELHGRAAQALEHQFAGRLEERYGLLAHHWSAAGDARRALQYAAQAAEAALSIYAYREAIEQFDRALEAAEELGLGVDDATARELRVRRGWARLWLGQVFQAEEDLQAALDGARGSGDRETEMKILNYLGFWRHKGYDWALERHREALALAESLGDVPAQVESLARRSIILSNQLRLDRALEVGRRALEVAEPLGDEQVEAKALDALKLVALQLGDLATLEGLTARLADINRRHNDVMYLSWTLLEAAFVPMASGDWDQAEALIEEANDLNILLGDRNNAPVFRDSACWLHRSRGDYDRALESGREAHELALRLEHSEWQGWTAATWGWALIEAGRPEDAIELLERGSAVVKQGALGQLIRCQGLLAWACWLSGEEHRGRELAEGADGLVGSISAPPGGAFLYGAHAQLALARVWLEAGEPERAEALAEPIRSAAESSGWREPLAGSLAVLGRARRDRALLERALEIARSTGLPAAEREAQEALTAAR